MLTDAEMNAYLRRLTPPRAGARSPLESAAAPVAAAGIPDRVRQSEETLLKMLERFGPDPDREAEVQELVRQGGEGLRMLADRDAEGLGSNPKAILGLEAIVRADGSRPSFLILNDAIDFTSSPAGDWQEVLERRADALRTAVAGVGRIDAGGKDFMGTGFLVGPNVVLTNRHVLQLIAEQQADKGWKLKKNAAIDFGHEHGGRGSVNRRALKAVLFWGSLPIDPEAVDHAKLDLAFLELEPGGDAGPEPFVLQTAPPDDSFGVPIVAVGYPGRPWFASYPPTLLDKLFRNSFGFKRLAPGEARASAASRQPWTLGHDATTLGGNSGSVVFALHDEGLALGLHYGGRPSGPAENWSHRLGLVLAETTGASAVPLAEVLAKHGVKFSSPPSVPRPPRPPAVVTETPAADGPVTLADMVRLGESAGGLEAAGDGETSAADLAGRGGYDPNFLPGFRIPFPLLRGAGAADMRKLRDGSGVELKYEHFSCVQSVSRRMPIATACNVNGAETKSVPRLQKWNYDGRLLREHQWGNELYQGRDNPFDRGHMVRREDPNWGPTATVRRANADTFHYTNSCPQMGAVNQQVWLGLENHILQHVKDDDMRVSVFTGPFFTDADPEYRGGRIPLSFWKIVAFLLPTGRRSATAYRVSQEREVSELEYVFGAYKTFQISIREVADETGLDFAAMLPFDGFSHHAATTGERLSERIDRVEQIRV